MVLQVCFLCHVLFIQNQDFLKNIFLLNTLLTLLKFVLEKVIEVAQFNISSQCIFIDL